MWEEGTWLTTVIWGDDEVPVATATVAKEMDGVGCTLVVVVGNVVSSLDGTIVWCDSNTDTIGEVGSVFW